MRFERFATVARVAPKTCRVAVWISAVVVVAQVSVRPLVRRESDIVRVGESVFDVVGGPAFALGAGACLVQLALVAIFSQRRVVAFVALPNIAFGTSPAPETSACSVLLKPFCIIHTIGRLQLHQVFIHSAFLTALDVVEEEVEGDQSQVWKSHASYFPLRAINLVFCCEFSTACELHSLVQYFCALLLLCSFL